ncbi:MAG: transcriptional repressor [Pyrinomonadaceae bacterium]|nr:transcriptional repressor [Sphingobacteriaceae bacterium]
MLESRFERLLDKNKLKKTKPRLSVLEALSSRKTATSQPELEQLVGKDIDRVTLYRTLNTFEEKGIIHKIIDLNGTANYAACDDSCTVHQHNDKHVHFNCTNCFNIYCLASLSVPEIVLPKGFTSEKESLIVYGVCDACSSKES